jgi:hypothetical protein
MTIVAGPARGNRGSDQPPYVDQLEGLADELAQRGLNTRLMAPQGRLPSLHVVNPNACRLAEDVYAATGKDGICWFWWPWAERIAPSDDVPAAATVIARVLAAHQVPSAD